MPGKIRLARRYRDLNQRGTEEIGRKPLHEWSVIGGRTDNMTFEEQDEDDDLTYYGDDQVREHDGIKLQSKFYPNEESHQSELRD